MLSGAQVMSAQKQSAVFIGATQATSPLKKFSHSKIGVIGSKRAT